MFDNFVIKNEADEAICDENLTDEMVSDEIVESVEAETEVEAVPVEIIQQETVVEDIQIVENTYSEEEFRNAIKTAEEVSYEKGFQAALNDETKQQNILLEDIKNQLMAIFASTEQRNIDMEKDNLRFMLSAIRKIFPTMEKENAAKEVQNFLSENFSSFAKQEVLSFSFNPSSASQAAKIIGKLAEQNDFEGKISVHKDETMGASDCRVEWKNGGSERNAAKILDQIEDLIQVN